jgi:hypothetical protein
MRHEIYLLRAFHYFASMIIKLSKNVLYAGILISILGQVNFFLSGIVYVSSLIYFLLNTFFFLINIVLLNEILRQIKQNHSFTILFILLFLAYLLGRAVTFISTDNLALSTSFRWIQMLLYFPVAIIITVKYFLLKGKLSDLFKIYGAFVLLSLFEGLFLNIAYRFMSVSGIVQIQWISYGLNFVKTFFICYIFFESSKCLDDNMEMSDNDILDNI